MKPIGYYCGYHDPAIEKFAEHFETIGGNCKLSDNDRIALVAILSNWRFATHTGVYDDFSLAVESAVGDGVETSLETEEPDAPLQIAIDILQFIHPGNIKALIQYLVQ